MPRKRVTIHYRRLYRTSAPPFAETLAAMLYAALNTRQDDVLLLDDAALRKYDDDDGASIILNGKSIATNGDIFGELIRFNPGTNMPLVLQAQERRAELEIRQAKRPDNADFLRGMIFFLLRGDHVLLIEQDLAISTLERYLRWIIFTASRVAERDTRLQLIPRLFFEDGAGALREVRSISLVPPPAQSGLPLSRPQSELVSGNVPDVDVFAVLRAAHFDSAVLDRLTRGDGGGVKVTINVEFKSGGKRAIISGDDAVALLRNIPEEDLLIRGVDAQRRAGVLERITKRAEIEQSGNILDRKDAWRKLVETASEYRASGLMP